MKFFKGLALALNIPFFLISLGLAAFIADGGFETPVKIAYVCIPFLLLLNCYAIYIITVPKVVYKERPKVVVQVKEIIKVIKPDDALFKFLRVSSIIVSVLFISISILIFKDIRNAELVAIWAIFSLIICLTVIIPGREGTMFLSLYLKRKKLEQLARIRELEEKTK